MQFYDTTTGQGICQEIDRLCDTDDTSYPRLSKTARVNQALDSVFNWIIGADGTWQFDDSNNTDLPIGTTTMVDSQQDYAFSANHLVIERVEVKLSDGTWNQLTPLDENAVDGGLADYQSTAGIPQEYAKKGNSIFLYPPPSSSKVTLTSGLKVYYKRALTPFTAVSTTTADTTQPGFASTFHVMLAYMASIPYCMTYKKDRIALYQNAVNNYKADLIKFYSRREKDIRPVMTMKPANYI